MKKLLAFLLCLSVLISHVACGGEKLKNCDSCNNRIPVSANFCEHCGTNVQSNTEAYTSDNTFETTSIETSVNTENPLDLLQGHWGCVIDGTCYGISFIQDQFTLWSYPGEYEPTGTITSFEQRNNELEITVYYPEMEYMGELCLEYEEQYCISSRDNYKSTLISNETEFTFLGTTEQDIWEKCDDLIANENSNQSDFQKETEYAIPYVSMSSQALSQSWEALKIRYGNSLGAKGFNGTAEATLHLKNISNLDCYYLSSYPAGELLGIENEKVVFYGIYGIGSSSYVRDIIPDAALTVAPATYPVNNGKLTAYIWELENGFLCIYGMEIGLPNWYDQPAFGYVLVSNINYLSFIG